MSVARRQKLFNQFSRNLALHNPELTGQFCCPLCTKLFSTVDKLDKAHLWPERLGGRQTTLTCRKCNNFIGSKIESFEVNRAKHKRALIGKEGFTRGWLEFEGDKQVTADFSGFVEGEQRGIRAVSVPASSNPKAVEALTKLLQDNTSVPPLRFRFRSRPEWDRAKLTYLHCAYLAMFHHFGYDWLRVPYTEDIRKQLLNPQEPLFDVGLISVPVGTTNIFQPSEQALVTMHVITAPEERIGFLVLAGELEYEENLRLGVWFHLSRTYEPSLFAKPEPNVQLSILVDIHSHLHEQDAVDALALTLRNALEASIDN